MDTDTHYDQAMADLDARLAAGKAQAEALLADQKRRRSVENTRVRAARDWMYQQRRSAAFKSRGKANRSVITLNGALYHFTKGYRFR